MTGPTAPASEALATPSPAMPRPAGLTLLGDPDATACEGDACLIPPAAQQ